MGLRAIGLAVFLGVSWVVGIRLLLLALRTRKLPEAAFGTCFVMAGGLGYGMVIAGTLFEAVPVHLRYPIAAVGLFAFHVGSGALWLAVWRIFRPEAGWAASLCAAALMLLAIAFVRDALVDRQPIPSLARSWYWVGLYARTGCIAWGALESLRYYRMLVRRTRLGLADPETALQFLCWGLGASAVFCMTGNTVALRLLPSYAAHPAGLWLSSLLGGAGAVLIWLTFFPPGFYRRSVARWARA